MASGIIATPKEELKIEDHSANISNGLNTSLQEMNSVAILNQFRPGLQYHIEQSGPSHNPTFKVSVEVDGKIYVGTGLSKKLAKNEAATQAVNDNTKLTCPISKNLRKSDCGEKNSVSLLNEIRSDIKYNFIERMGPQHHPTFKVEVTIDGTAYCGIGNSKKEAKLDVARKILKDNPNFIIENGKKDKNVKTINIEEKNPVSILNELTPDLTYSLVEYVGPSHNPTYKMSIEINDQVFLGVGSSKKDAKIQAAMQALKSFTSDKIAVISVKEDEMTGKKKIISHKVVA